MENKVALVTAKEMWSEFEKMKAELKNEIMYDINQNANKKLYTRKELAKYLKVSTQTIINWSGRGIINPVYIQGRVYYKAEEIEEILK